MLSGLTGLLWENGRRAYGESWPFRWTEARQVAQYFCTNLRKHRLTRITATATDCRQWAQCWGQMTQVNSPFQATMQVFPPMIGMVLMAA